MDAMVDDKKRRVNVNSHLEKALQNTARVELDSGIARMFYTSECGHNRKSPPSFCNGLGTVNILSFQERAFDLTTRDMGYKLKYGLGKILGTQKCPTLRLAFSHCVLCFNFIKGAFNIVILN